MDEAISKRSIWSSSDDERSSVPNISELHDEQLNQLSDASIGKSTEIELQEAFEDNTERIEGLPEFDFLSSWQQAHPLPPRLPSSHTPRFQAGWERQCLFVCCYVAPSSVALRCRWCLVPLTANNPPLVFLSLLFRSVIFVIIFTLLYLNSNWEY